MKEIDELVLPENVRYSNDHEWIEAGKDTAKIGISDYAQDQLGDIVFVEFPDVGTTFEKGDEFGTVESVKAVSELYIPVAGEVVAVNPALENAPELVNKSPYTDGWIIEIKLADPSQVEQLLTRAAYIQMLKGNG